MAEEPQRLAERYAITRGSSEKITPVKVIGSGSSGTVYQCISHIDQMDVAVKVISKSLKRVIMYTRREIENHGALEHPHIVKYMHNFEEDNYHCIVMEYAAGGTLLKRVMSRKCESEAWARWFFQQIICAVDFCHKKGVVVRDIKLENMLLDKEQKILKLCDFGFSKHERHGAPATQLGTPLYAAPEIIHNFMRDYDGEKVDVWACGICLYIMIYGQHPFIQQKNRRMGMPFVLRNIVWEKITIPRIQVRSGNRKIEISEDCRSLLERMLCKDPKGRADLPSILSDPWFLENLPDGAVDYNAQLLKVSS